VKLLRACWGQSALKTIKEDFIGRNGPIIGTGKGKQGSEKEEDAVAFCRGCCVQPIVIE
jgi:hypothetical protein